MEQQQRYKMLTQQEAWELGQLGVPGIEFSHDKDLWFPSVQAYGRPDLWEFLRTLSDGVQYRVPVE